MEPDIAKAFLRTIQQIKDATAISRIEAAIRRRDMAAVLNAIPLQEFEKQFQADIARTIRDVAEKGAEVAAMPGGITASLNVTNPEVFDFIREATLNPILKIRAESENAIRDALFKAFSEGVHPYDMARQIRDIVGLTANQWETVDRYRQYFEDLSPSVVLPTWARRHSTSSSAGRIDAIRGCHCPAGIDAGPNRQAGCKLHRSSDS